MKNFDYGKKYHYMVKYLIIALPVLLLLLLNFTKDSLLYDELYNNLTSLAQTLRGLTINDWYNNLLDVIGLDVQTDLSYLLSTYPLYILWVYILDIILDVLAVIPRLAHRLLSKFGGDY